MGSHFQDDMEFLAECDRRWEAKQAAYDEMKTAPSPGSPDEVDGSIPIGPPTVEKRSIGDDRPLADS